MHTALQSSSGVAQSPVLASLLMPQLLCLVTESRRYCLPRFQVLQQHSRRVTTSSGQEAVKLMGRCPRFAVHTIGNDVECWHGCCEAATIFDTTVCGTRSLSRDRPLPSESESADVPARMISLVSPLQGKKTQHARCSHPSLSPTQGQAGCSSLYSWSMPMTTMHKPAHQRTHGS